MKEDEGNIVSELKDDLGETGEDEEEGERDCAGRRRRREITTKGRDT